jgi:hypothetical protein
MRDDRRLQQWLWFARAHVPYDRVQLLERCTLQSLELPRRLVLVEPHGLREQTLVLAAASDSCLEALVEILAAAGELGVLARHRIA